MENFETNLKKYFAVTPKEKVLKDYENSKKVNSIRSEKELHLLGLNNLILSDISQIEMAKKAIGRLEDIIKTLENGIKIRKDILEISDTLDDNDDFDNNYRSNIEIKNLIGKLY